MRHDLPHNRLYVEHVMNLAADLRRIKDNRLR